MDGVKDGDVKDLDRSDLTGESSNVVSGNVNRLEQGVGCGEAVGELDNLTRNDTIFFVLESLPLQSLDEAENPSCHISGINGEARKDSDAHLGAKGGTTSDLVSPAESFGAESSTLFVVETDETLSVGSLESVLGVSNSFLGPD